MDNAQNCDMYVMTEMAKYPDKDKFHTWRYDTSKLPQAASGILRGLKVDGICQTRQVSWSKKIILVLKEYTGSFVFLAPCRYMQGQCIAIKGT
jgi:hypothetical protein